MFKTFQKVLLDKYSFLLTNKMAKSSFEYVKKFELDDTLLPNTWIVIRLDGKCFHKFADDHKFEKPNDRRALELMNYTAFTVLKQYQDVLMAYGQSDEYSFVLRKECSLFKRRSAKLLTTINSTFSASYVYYWKQFFGEQMLKYPPSFDGRVITYPARENLMDYLKWRQADVHINNLYNTAFWSLVSRGGLTPAQAEKKLCGTVSADKNEILFNQFNINYNNEPEMFRRGTILLRRPLDPQPTSQRVIVDVHEDMMKDKFWTLNSFLLLDTKGRPEIPVCVQHFTDIVKQQIKLVK